jgi:hypothetical protein
LSLCRALDFRIKIEEGLQAGSQLLLNFFLAPFEDVHGDTGIVSVLELDNRISHFGYFIGRQQPQSVHQGQVGHPLILFSAALRRRFLGLFASFRVGVPVIYNAAVPRPRFLLPAALGWAVLAGGQQAPPQPPQPQVKVNVLNVCSPSAAEQTEISTALSHVPRQPLFGADFEVDRGQSSLEDTPNFLQPGQNAQMSAASGLASWVRIRREFSVQALFSTVQYSFSVDPKNMVETLVFRVRDPRDLMQLSIEDSASNVSTPAAMLATATPATRIKLERFGKSSVVLARCTGSDAGPAPDQSGYEPLFRNASSVVANYRTLLGAQNTVPEELTRAESGAGTHPKIQVKGTPKRPSTVQR